jgi:hypothetical protein
MATNAERDAWLALGGQIEDKTIGNRKSKVLIAPDGERRCCCLATLLWLFCCSPAFQSFLPWAAVLAAGKRLKTWKEAAEIMKAAKEQEKHGRHSSSICGSSIGSSSAPALHAVRSMLLVACCCSCTQHMQALPS